MTVVKESGILGGEPHIEGTRIGVRHVAAKVVDGGHSPAYVADQFDLSLGSVYEALAYYYNNTEEIREFERENTAAFERLRDSTLKPKEPIS